MKGNDDTVHFLMGSCLSLRCFSGCHSHVAPHAITVTVIYKNQKSRKEEEKRGECKRNNEACFGSLESHFFGVGRMSKAFASRAELLTLLKSKMHAQEKKKDIPIFQLPGTWFGAWGCLTLVPLSKSNPSPFTSQPHFSTPIKNKSPRMLEPGEGKENERRKDVARRRGKGQKGSSDGDIRI